VILKGPASTVSHATRFVACQSPRMNTGARVACTTGEGSALAAPRGDIVGTPHGGPMPPTCGARSSTSSSPPSCPSARRHRRPLLSLSCFTYLTVLLYTAFFLIRVVKSINDWHSTLIHHWTAINFENYSRGGFGWNGAEMGFLYFFPRIKSIRKIHHFILIFNPKK